MAVATRTQRCEEVGCRRRGWHGCRFCIEHTYPRDPEMTRRRRTYDRRMALEAEIRRLTAPLQKKLRRLE